MNRVSKAEKIYKNKELYFVILFFILSSLLRTLLALLYCEFTVFFDELVHWKIANNIANGSGIALRGYKIPRTDILYSLIISITGWIKDPIFAHKIVFVLNSLMMSSVVFPVYLLSKKLKVERKYIYIIILLSILVPELTYTGMALQENLMYPLAIWYFVIFLYTLEHFSKLRNYVILALACFTLCLVKDFSLSFFVGTTLFLITKLFIEKEERKKYGKAIGIYMFSFLSIWLVYRYFINIVTAEEALILSNSSIFSRIKDNLLNFEKLVRMVYPAIVYFIFAITFFGFFTILVPITQFKKLCQQGKDLIIISGFILFSYIGVICSTITITENYDSTSIRIHYRYFFFLFLPFLIVFLSLGKNIKINLNLLICTILYFIVLGYINLIPAPGSVIDFPTGAILKKFNSEMLKITIPLLFILIISILYILLKYQYIKLFLSVSLGILIFLFVNSNFITYRMLNEAKNFQKNEVEDAVKINKYIKENKNPTDLLIIGNTNFSTCLTEQYLEETYKVTTLNNFKQILSSENFNGLTMVGLNKDYISEKSYSPQYIITEEKIQIEGYKKINLELSKYYMYEKDDKKNQMSATIIPINIYEDYWVNKNCNIMIGGLKEEISTKVEITVDTIFEDEMKIKIVDTTGNTQEIVAAPTRNTYVLTIYKNANENGFKITLSTQNSYVPDNGDVRELSFRVLSINKVEEETKN